MVLMPIAPSMLDARNAILAADMARFGGANQDELWYAFATRGFGQSAFALSGGDVQPKPAFDSPRHEEATVRFRAFAGDEGNAPVRANVYVGHYEARVSPIADTNPATGPADGSAAADASNLDNVASFTPRQYELTANAPDTGSSASGPRSGRASRGRSTSTSPRTGPHATRARSQRATGRVIST